MSNDEKANLASQAGADEVIIYTQESFYDGVMKITNHLGVHVVYDAVGKTTFDDSLKSLAYRGMLVLYGQASGSVLPLDMSRLSEKSLFLTRPVLWHYTMTKIALNDMSSALFKLIIDNKLKITIG